MTTIAELFAQEPLRVDPGMDMLLGSRFNHVPEIPDYHLYGAVYTKDFCPKITQVVFHEVTIDYKRSHILYGVKFADAWVMLCAQAGRDHDDFQRRQVVSPTSYRNMINYIRDELIRIGEIELPEKTPMDTEVEFTFYGRDVRKPYYEGSW